MTALVLTATSTVTRPNLDLSFLATGGTTPYTYSVVGGGAGGTISPSGIYTAPNGYGSDTVKVTDSAVTPAIATRSVLIASPVALVCDIIQKGMDLSADQVWMWDQKINTPNDSRLYVAVGVASCKPFANTNRPDTSGSGMDSIQSTNFMATLSIDILSRSLDAVNRKEELLMALNSNYAQYQQSANSFFLAPISTGFVNLSEVDGAAIPYRFNITVNMQYSITKTSAVAYFDDFTDSEITDP